MTVFDALVALGGLAGVAGIFRPMFSGFGVVLIAVALLFA